MNGFEDLENREQATMEAEMSSEEKAETELIDRLYNEFHELATPLIEWLGKNLAGHSLAIITTERADIVQGMMGFPLNGAEE